MNKVIGFEGGNSYKLWVVLKDKGIWIFSLNLTLTQSNTTHLLNELITWHNTTLFYLFNA